MEIPREPMVIKADNETYNVGCADESGVRTIIKEGGKSPFSDCKIKVLAKGEIMIFIHGGGRLQTTPRVDSITIVPKYD